MKPIPGRLAAVMTAQVFDGRTTHMPVVSGVARLGNVSTYPFRALVDSGATWTLAQMGIARGLGLDPAVVRRSPDRVRFRAAAGPVQEAHGVALHLVLTGGGGSRVEIPDALVFFSDAPASEPRWPRGGGSGPTEIKTVSKSLALSGERFAITLRS